MYWSRAVRKSYLRADVIVISFCSAPMDGRTSANVRMDAHLSGQNEIMMTADSARYVPLSRHYNKASFVNISLYI